MALHNGEYIIRRTIRKAMFINKDGNGALRQGLVVVLSLSHWAEGVSRSIPRLRLASSGKHHGNRVMAQLAYGMVVHSLHR